MNNLPPAVRSTLEFLYGEDKWWRLMAMLMTVCVLFFIGRSTRRPAAIAFVVLFVAGNIWHYLQEAYKQYTPSDTVVNQPTRKRYLR